MLTVYLIGAALQFFAISYHNPHWKAGEYQITLFLRALLVSALWFLWWPHCLIGALRSK